VVTVIKSKFKLVKVAVKMRGRYRIASGSERDKDSTLIT
jgi:hypothetical protein